jgi:hypothetical protein
MMTTGKTSGNCIDFDHDKLVVEGGGGANFVDHGDSGSLVFMEDG